MHVLIRSSHIRSRPLTVFKRKLKRDYYKGCSHSNQFVKCLCGEHTERNRNFYTPQTPPIQIQNNLTPLLRYNANDRLLFIANPTSNVFVRNLSLSSLRFDKEPLKPSSKVEVSVQEIKKQKEDLATSPPKEVVKKNLKQRIVDELIHYYHGFRLLFIDIKISSILVFRILKGHTLTRRERRMLIRTVGDLFRLVPFSVFIIVPFMEFLLPVFIKFFPNMLPSTFQSASDQQAKIKKNLAGKLEMAKFLQQTLDEMSVQNVDRKSQQAKEFHEWFQRMRASEGTVSNEDIMKYAKLFEDEITLDSLTRNQLVALCRVLEVQTLGTNNFLRFQLRMKLRTLAADDKMIQKEGVNSLNLAELQAACRARGMRAYGVSEIRLRSQMVSWLDLSLNEKVPPSLLLLSRALMLPETIPTTDKLKATISSLSETVVAQTKVAIGEKEGKIDNKVKFEAIKEEVKKIREERAEEQKKQEEEQKETIVDKAPILTDTTQPIVDPAKIVTADTVVAAVKPPVDGQLDSKSLEAIEHALVNIAKDQKKLILEKETIQDLKEELADYQEDVQDLKKATAGEVEPVVTESKAAKRLFKKVNKLISNMDTIMKELESKEKQIKKDLEQSETDGKKQELLHIDDIMTAIRKLQNVPDEARASQIETLLKKMDDDYDGSVKVEHVLKVISMIGKDNVNLNAKQLDEIIELLGKEEILEVEEKIEKALQKEKEQCYPQYPIPVKPQPAEVVVGEQKASATSTVPPTEIPASSQSSTSTNGTPVSADKPKQMHLSSDLSSEAPIPPPKDPPGLKKLEKR